MPRRGTQARRAGARRPQATSYTGPSANAAAHAAALYTLYAYRSTAGPAHCTLTARLRLHGPCYRAKVHGTCADRAHRGISLSPSRLLRRLLRRPLTFGLSIVAFSSSSPICAEGRPPAVHTAPPGQQTPRRSASVRHACANSHIDCLPSALERALLALPQSRCGPLRAPRCHQPRMLRF